MAKQTSKDQLLSDIRTERRRLERNLSALSVEEMTRPGVVGTWSVKDVLAHLAAWESLFLEWYREGLHGDTPGTQPAGMSRKAIDAINLDIYEKNKERSLEEIQAGFQESFREILAVLEAIPEEEMFAWGRFGWTGNLTLADYIAGNTCNHYAWANSQVRKWSRQGHAGTTLDRTREPSPGAQA